MFAALFIVAACGDDSSDNSIPAPGGGTGNGTGSGTGSGNGSGGVCNFSSYGAGVAVFFTGTQGAGTSFPDVNKSYFGTISALYYNPTTGQQFADVSFPHQSVLVRVTLSTLATIGSCNPDITNRRVLYNGVAGANFPAPADAPNYAGNIVRVFGGNGIGYVEVNWDHLTPNVAVTFGQVLLSN